jgi:hypothetical protein
LWKWQRRAVREGHIQQEGNGSRKEPYRYFLPDMVEKWQANFLANFMQRLERDAERAAPASPPAVEESAKADAAPSWE